MKTKADIQPKRSLSGCADREKSEWLLEELLIAAKFMLFSVTAISTTVFRVSLFSCSNHKPGMVMVQTQSRQDKKQAVPQSIGTATMTDDGTIILDLRAEGPEGAVGYARLVYPPTHAQYAEVLKRLGGLRPGETKQVPPWP
jgi:hypothetical protein